MSITELMITSQQTSDMLREAMDANPPADLLSAYFALQGLAVQVIIQLRNEGFFSSSDGQVSRSVVEEWAVDHLMIALSEANDADELQNASMN